MTTISHREFRELGDVHWCRDYDAALTRAFQSGMPILLLFQEVPGCAGCVNFGHDVLKQPLLVEFIENSFVPLAIFNNRPGPDAEILNKFGETAWNYPVMYFLDGQGQQIVPRLAKRYDPISLYEKLVAALETSGAEVPKYAKLLRNDLLVELGLARSMVFATPCFWSGETTLAQHPAVLTTEAGWVGGEEVVKVHLDPDHSDAASLKSYAMGEGFPISSQKGYRPDAAPQYYLSKSRYAKLSLSQAQRTRLNLAIPYKDNPDTFLTPDQTRQLARM